MDSIGAGKIANHRSEIYTVLRYMLSDEFLKTVCVRTIHLSAGKKPT